MRRSFVALITLALVSVTTPGGAAAAENLEFVGNVPFSVSTHLEFFERDGRTYAVSGARDDADAGVWIVDVTDPEAPLVTSHVACGNGGNADIGIFADLNLLVFTIDSNGADATGCPTPGSYQFFTKNIVFVDISDLANPVLLGSPIYANGLAGIHTIVVHPTKPIAYLSDQETPDRGPEMKILDLTALDATAPDPRDGRIIRVPMPRVGSGPHDTTFSPDGTRAYVSAVTASYVLDTTDPLNPTVISHIVDPTIQIHHEAMLHPNGRHLFITDEWTGALLQPQCPGGGVHIYDLGPDGLLEAAPVKVGVFFAQEVENFVSDLEQPRDLPVCTAHEGTFSEDGSLLSLAWYRAGARLFDVSALNEALPPGTPLLGAVSEVGFNRADRGEVWVDAWAAKMHPNVPGYVFVTNQPAGLDVYRFAEVSIQ